MPRLLLVLAAFLLAAAARAAAPAQPAPAAPAAPAAAPADSNPSIDQEALLAEVTSQIADHFHLEGKLHLDLARAWSLPSLPAGTPFHTTVVEFTSAPASSMLVRCRLEAGGAPLPLVTLSLRAQLWTDVWTTREPLESGQAFDPSRLDTRPCDLLRDRDAIPADIADRDLILARSVPAGRTLTWRDVARRPLVRRGETVEVSAVEGPLSVTLKALATQNGAKGDTVLVRNLESRKEFTAVVVDENRVQVRF